MSYLTEGVGYGCFRKVGYSIMPVGVLVIPQPDHSPPFHSGDPKNCLYIIIISYFGVDKYWSPQFIREYSLH